MKWFLLSLCLAAAEKLDRTYLPPPGAKYSGGIPGDIQVPFEIPKETYSTTLRPDDYNNGTLSPEDTRIEVGINRGVPSRPGLSGDVTPEFQAPDYYQTYKVPTTTSYAFTTTRTHPPGEVYETATGPIYPVTGLPSTTFDYPTSAPGFLNPDLYDPENIQGTSKQNQFPDRVPPSRPSQYPVTTTLVPSLQYIDQSHPGFIQGSNLDHDANQREGVGPGSVQRPITTPDATHTQNQENQYPVNVPGVGQQNSLAPSTFAPSTVASTTFAPGTFAPTTFAPTTTPSHSQQYGGDLDQGVVSNQNISSSQRTIHTGPSSSAQTQNQPQFVTPGRQLSQEIYQQPGQVQYVTNKGGVFPQQYPISQTDEFGRPVAHNDVYPSFSTASPTTLVPNLTQFQSSTPGFQPSATTVYPSGTIAPGIVGSQGVQTGLIPRSERPQAEADRNAVILNYENIITPEGFAYSFDTSNGIHADESGTVVDGVKAKGSYSYIGDDGKLYNIVYTADENGFQPRGEHLPTSPPIPEAILKVIEQAKKDQEAGISDDGTYDENKYGHMKYESVRYRSQQPNNIIDDNEVPYTYNGQYGKPHKDTKRPVSTHQDYEDIGEEQGQVGGDGEINYEQRRPSTQKPFIRPINRISEGNKEQYNPEIDFNEGSGYGSSDDKIYSTSLPGDDRRQFGGKFSVQRPGQYTETHNDNLKPEYRSSLNEKRPGSTMTQDNYSAEGSRRNSINSQSIQSPDIESNDRRLQNIYGQRPSGTVDEYNRPGSPRPSQYPSKAGVSRVPSGSQGTYDNKIRPVTSMVQPVDETDAYTYQNSRRPGGLDKYLPNKGVTEKPVSSSTTIAPTSSQYLVEDTKPQGVENVSGESYREPSNQPPSRIPGSIVYDSTGSQVLATGSPSTDNISYQYSSSRGKPQSSITPVTQQGNEYYNNRIIEPTSYQNGRRLVSGRHPCETTRYTTITPTIEKGYQYLPPQRKFGQETLTPGGSVIFSTRKPSQDRTSNKKGEVPKPFTTPDASRSEEGAEDDYDHVQNNKPRIQYSQFQPSQRPVTTQKPYGTYDRESTPDTYEETRLQRPGLQENGRYGIKLDAARIPGESIKVTTTGSTHRPPYQQIQTTLPQHEDRPGSVYETTQGITSNPVPSQSIRYEVTQLGNSKPGQQTTDRYIGGGQTPSTQGYFTQTTKLPAQSPEQFNVRPIQNIYEQTSSQSPYQTIYRPMVTYSGVRSDEAPSATIRPGRPGFSQNQVPSTTYRPAYYPGQVTEKQVTVDNFGRLLPQQPTEGEYRPGTSVTPGNISPSSQDSRRPVVDMYGRSTGPVQGNMPSYAGPDGNSTTEKIIREDFSGPKQQQRFDPERGYYYK